MPEPPGEATRPDSCWKHTGSLHKTGSGRARILTSEPEATWEKTEARGREGSAKRPGAQCTHMPGKATSFRDTEKIWGSYESSHRDAKETRLLRKEVSSTEVTEGQWKMGDRAAGWDIGLALRTCLRRHRSRAQRGSLPPATLNPQWLLLTLNLEDLNDKKCPAAVQGAGVTERRRNSGSDSWQLTWGKGEELGQVYFKVEEFC